MIKSFHKLEYSIGGYSQGEKSYILEGDEITFWDNGMLGGGRPPEEWISKKIINEKDKEKLRIALNDLSFLEWEKEYCDDNVLDGTQWTILVTYNGNLKKKVYGSNAYPKRFETLERELKKITK
jgi:hypothetical protein